MSFYKKHKMDCPARETVSQQQDSHHAAPVDESGPTQLLRYRVVAQAGFHFMCLVWLTDFPELTLKVFSLEIERRSKL